MASCRPLIGLVMALRGLVSASHRPCIGLELASFGLEHLRPLPGNHTNEI
jgi:hypothetical protein